MDKIEQYIKSKCVENDPSIMELKGGCFVKDTDGKEVMLSYINTYGDWIASHGDFHGARVLDIDPKVGKYKILGRDIFIGDVLGAIGKIGREDIFVTVNGNFITCEWSEERGTYFLGTNVKWNLKKPLHKQTEKTKLLLARILGIKE